MVSSPFFGSNVNYNINKSEFFFGWLGRKVENLNYVHLKLKANFSFGKFFMLI